MGSARGGIGLLVAPLVLGAVVACGSDAGEEVATDDDALVMRPTVVDQTLPDVDAIGYEIKLRVDDATPRQETFAAEVKGTYVATRDLDELSLDFDGNTIDGVKVGTRNAEHRREGARLVVKLPARVAQGARFTTRITYHGDVRQADGADPNDFAAFGGLMVKQRNADGKRIFTSLNWPSKARRWIPLRDHPRDGAMVTFDVTFPTRYVVLANGRRTSARANADGTKTWRYEALQPMPVYDFHVSAYDSWKVDEAQSASGVPVTTYTYAGAHRQQPAVYGDVARVADFYGSRFGAYRWGPLGYIEEPIFGGGMEHASVISMDETLFTDAAEARTTAFHELAHHWSGNLVRIRTWNDFWLSEGFTEYLTARARAEVDGDRGRKDAYREYLASTLEADRANPHPLRPADPEIDVLTIFDGISYQKGALTLRMIERIVGEAKMTAFLRGWFDRHAFTAMTTKDLERELSEATGVDLSKLFATFVYAGYHPELRVTFTAAGEDTEIKVEQVQTKGPPGGFVFPLDLDMVDASGRAERVTIDLTSKTTTRRVRLARPAASVVVDPEETIVGVATCGQSGGGACRADYRCAPQGGGVSVCVPR